MSARELTVQALEEIEKVNAVPANARIPALDPAKNKTVMVRASDLGGGGGGTDNIFKTIRVAGQSDVVADQNSDVLTLVAGSNVTITTDAATDSVTINATPGGGASNSFVTIQVAGQSDVVADQASDTLTLVAGSNITITTNAAGDTITFAATTGGGGLDAEGAQDAIGAIINTSLTYDDAGGVLKVTPRTINGVTFDATANITVPNASRVTAAGDATPVAFNADTTDTVTIAEQSQNFTLSNPTGTLRDEATYYYRITTTTSRTISYGTKFRGTADLALPTATTGSGKTDRMAFKYNAAADKLDIVAKNFGA